MIAFDIRCYDRLGSTQDEARRLAQAGAAHGTVVTAGEQTAGRGRLGRRWISPPGNLYLSILLRLDLPPARLTELNFVASLAVADAVDAFVPGPPAAVKWPNDVLVDGAKISGILIEQARDATILGIGLNVRSKSDQHYAVTSLVHAGAEEPDITFVRTVILDALARRWHTWQRDGFAPIRKAWLPRAHSPGTALCVSASAHPLRGKFVGIDDDGALLLDSDHVIHRVIAGDVQID